MKLHFGQNKKASLYYVGSGAAVKALFLLITPILTRLLAPDEMGIYAVFAGYMGVLTVFFTLEAAGSGIYGALSKTRKTEDFAASLLIFVFCVCLAFSLLYLLFREKINAVSALDTPLTLILILQIFLNTAESLHFAKLRYEGKYKSVASLTLLIGVSDIALTLIFVALFHLGGRGRIYAVLAVRAVFALSAALPFLRGKKFSFERGIFDYISKRLLPLFPHYLSQSAISNSAKLIITSLIGVSAVGKYSTAHAFALGVGLFTTGIFGAFCPWFNRVYSEDNLTRVRAATKNCIISALCFTALYLLFTPIVFPLFVADEYREAAVCVYPLSLYVVFTFISNILSQILFRREMSKWVSLTSLMSFVLCLFLSLNMSSKIGIFGASLAMLLCEVFASLTKAFLLRKSRAFDKSALTVCCLFALLVFLPFLFV